MICAPSMRAITSMHYSIDVDMRMNRDRTPALGHGRETADSHDVSALTGADPRLLPRANDLRGIDA